MKIYKCKCGKEFTEPNKFNNHKSNCKIHLGENYNINQLKKLEGCKKGGKTTSDKWKKINQEKLEQWVKEEHKCKTCGKIMTIKIRDGNYCSKSCAAAHGRIKKKDLNKKFQCIHCSKKFKNEVVLNRHYYNDHPEKYNKDEKLVESRSTRTLLNITKRELEEYRKIHTICEICGKTLKETKNKLVIDHDHNTNKFRGLLCNSCNRSLGWYENNKENINKYLQEK